jgi:MFS family permease
VGGFLALLLAQRGRLARDFGVGVLLWSAPLVLVAIWPTLAAAAAVMIVLGLANSVVDVNAYTIVQRIAPEESMARVFGAMESALIGGMALGALLMPLLIATVGLRWGLAAIGSAGTACVVAGAAALRRVDRSALAPEGLALLRKVSLLSLLPEQTLERFARRLIRVEAAPGEIVIRQGDPGDRFYVVESGALDVSQDGRFLRTLGPGDFAGEIALLRDVPRTATVTATAPTVLQALERAVFIPAVTGQGAFAEAADAAIATRLSML